MERTLVLVKPDGVQRGLSGEILSRFERRGLRFAGIKMLSVSRDLAERHYAVHQGKFFFQGLVDFITSGPIIAVVVEGPQAIGIVRSMIGVTRPAEAAPGTIRGDYAVAGLRNLVHASDAPEPAGQEILLYFRPEELVDYARDVDKWIYEGA